MTRLILKAKIPYTDGSNEKSRPVLQLNDPCDEYDNFQVVFLTSQKPKIKLFTDLTIKKSSKLFDGTGLTKTSYIRVSKIFTIDPTVVEGVLGKLPEELESKLNNIIIKNLKL